MRLTKIFSPTHYALNYTKLDLETNTFEGAVDIEIQSNDSTEEGNTTDHDSIILHALELHILDGFLLNKSCRDDDHQSTTHAGENKSRKVELSKICYNKKDQTCELFFSGIHNLGSWRMFVLHLKFCGELNRNMQGLYRSSYTGLDGKVKAMACTQFEATDARRAFPCFDEPNFKATFQLAVTLKYREGNLLEAVSNTPVETTKTTCTSNGTFKEWRFSKTPLMSAYLLALVVGDFDAVSRTSPTTRVQTSVYTIPGKALQGTFCLDVASKCLDLYEELFSVPYPLPKSDLLAIPDFAAGAMENWGCVTYREAKILVKEGSTSQSTLQGIARTVCHELAHQWFGNLVTMDWWKELWLNEGFARYMEFVAINHLFPEWDVWTEFVQSVYGLALSLDAMDSSHPVEVEVATSEEISEIFDAISYAKGASIIRMCSSHLGFKTFMEGLQLYLKRHAYDNATTLDLWAALSEVSGIDVGALMSPWTSQVGFPLVLVEEDGNVSIKRYRARGSSNKDEYESLSWPIPVTVIVEGENKVYGPWVVNGLHNDDTLTLTRSLKKWDLEGKWFKLNVSQTGFYRVGYTSNQWQRLAKSMQPGCAMSASDRLGLLSDSFAMGKAGYSCIVESLRLANSYSDHDVAEYAVWQELAENLLSLASLYRSEPYFDKFQDLLITIFIKQHQKLGWDSTSGESNRMGTLRGTIVRVLGVAGHQGVVSEALGRFRLYVEDCKAHSISGDMRSIIFSIAMKESEDEVFGALQHIFETTTFPEEQRNCLSAMGKCQSMDRHSELISYVLYSGKVRLQDMAFPFVSLALISNEGGKACWRFFSQNYEKLSNLFKASPLWSSLVASSCRGLRTIEDIDAVESFWADSAHEAGSGQRRLTQALEAVKTNAIRLQRDREAVYTYLNTISMK